LSSSIFAGSTTITKDVGKKAHMQLCCANMESNKYALPAAKSCDKQCHPVGKIKHVGPVTPTEKADASKARCPMDGEETSRQSDDQLLSLHASTQSGVGISPNNTSHFKFAYATNSIPSLLKDNAESLKDFLSEDLVASEDVSIPEMDNSLMLHKDELAVSSELSDFLGNVLEENTPSTLVALVRDRFKSSVHHFSDKNLLKLMNQQQRLILPNESKLEVKEHTERQGKQRPRGLEYQKNKKSKKQKEDKV
jgi:hypothetical protein